MLAAQVATIPAEQLVVYGGAPGARQVLALVLPPLLPLAVAVLLVVTRARFAVRAPSGTYRRLGLVAASALVLAAVAYVGGGTLAAGGFDR